MIQVLQYVNDQHKQTDFNVSSVTVSLTPDDILQYSEDRIIILIYYRLSQYLYQVIMNLEFLSH